MTIRAIQPAHFARPRGYANGMLGSGQLLFVGGQIGWQADQTFATEDFVEQFAQTLDNVIDVVKAAGGEATDIADMTIYVTDLDAYRNGVAEIGAVWRERMGKHYPAMALVGVNGLVMPQAKVEIQAVAILSDRAADRSSRRPSDAG